MKLNAMGRAVLRYYAEHPYGDMKGAATAAMTDVGGAFAWTSRLCDAGLLYAPPERGWQLTSLGAAELQLAAERDAAGAARRRTAARRRYATMTDLGMRRTRSGGFE